jgi:FtsH-binding integral membrane protein
MANPNENTLSWTQAGVLSRTAKFMSRVYGWMMMGVAMSGIVAYLVAQNESLTATIFQTPGAIWGIFLLQFALVIGLGAALNRISSTFAGLLYFVYAAVTGVTLSFIFLVYAHDSIFSMFFMTAFAFGGLSAVGYLTKRDLGPVGSFCMMGLFGMIAFSLVAFFFPSVGGGQASLLFSAIGLLVFSGLTAYDTQKIKRIYQSNSGTPEAERKLAIYGALTLYLDFINLFLNLLRIFGRRR